MRIIGGTLRGSRVEVPDAPGLRPTPNRVRETLFNWLQPMIEGAHCLDLYSGTGANGIEAASRGAASLVMVERDRAVAARLEDNLRRLRITSAEVVCADALAWLRRGPRPDAPRRDIVFMDPPFALDVAAQTAAALEAGGWLAPRALIYVELPHPHAVPLPPNWTVHRQGRAGALGYTLHLRTTAETPAS